MNPNQHYNALNQHDMLHWYEIQEILGQGGFGITYLALDTNLDQKVAIKEYLPTEFSTRDVTDSVQPISENHTEIFNWGKKRFLDEARTLAQFRHPNIVRVSSFFENNNTGYMVMEYEEGTDLGVMIKSGEVFDEQGLLDLLLPILDGLEQIHAQGFIHRDIKPANIFIREDGSPVLIDFGSARQAIGGQTRTLTSLVTPGFAPFEQYHDSEGKQGPWTDIYSLGATCYSILTGKPPVDALKRGMARLDHSTDAYLGLNDLKAGRFSEHLLLAIDKALEFKESDRPQSVVEWKSMLLDKVQVAQSDVVTQINTPPPPADKATISDDTSVEATQVATRKSETSQPGNHNNRKLIGIMVVIVVLVVIALFALLPESEPQVVTETPNLATKSALEPEATEQASVDLPQPATVVVENAGLKPKQERIAAEKEKPGTEQALLVKQQQAELAQQQKEQDEDQQQLAKKQAAEEKRLQELAKKQAAEEKRLQELAKKQAAEKKRQQELAKKQAAEKKRQQELARKRKAEQKRLAKLALIEQQQKLVAQSGKQKSVDLTTGFSGLFAPDEGFEDLKLTQKGSKVKGIIGTNGSTLEGVIDGNRLIFEFNYSRTGYGFKKGTGELTLSDDGQSLSGNRFKGGFAVRTAWNLKRVGDMEKSGSNSPVNLFSDLTGMFIPDEGFEELVLIQKGNKIKGTIGRNGSTFSGTRKGNTISFVFNYSRTGYGFKDGYGKLMINNDGSRLTGTRSSAGFPKNSSWNLTRKLDN